MGIYEQIDVSNMDIINKSNPVDQNQQAKDTHGLKIAAWAIVGMIVYLVIAQ